MSQSVSLSGFFRTQLCVMRVLDYLLLNPTFNFSVVFIEHPTADQIATQIGRIDSAISNSSHKY